MNCKESVERTCVGKPQGTLRDKSHLIFGFVLAAGLVLSQANCSSRSSSVPTPPTPPTPPTSSTPTSEKTTPAGGEESTEESQEASGSESSSPSPSEKTAAAGAVGGAQTTEERTDHLDRKLDSSLTEFDGILLKEQEILDERRQATGGESLGGGYGATGEEQSGSEVSGEPQTGEEDQEYAQGGASGGSPDAPAGEDSESAPGESMGADQAQMESGRVPPDVGDGSDDDIVARQLREAAMKEEDPELREKLWDEYRAYTKGMKES